jgi:hypothetical protein
VWTVGRSNKRTVESAQDNTVAIVAIAVSGGVALAVAILAAVTAHYRQKAVLAHDRKMRAREESIEALDAALAASFAWVGRLVRVESYWRERRDLDDPEVKTLLVETNASIQAMYAAGARLDVRFGENSAISKGFEEMLNTVRSLGQALKPYGARASFVDHAETVSETERQANDALKKFVEEAKSWRDSQTMTG